MNPLLAPFFVLYFLIAVIIAFYIPGRVILGERKGLSTLAIVSLSLLIGVALWGWQGYILGYLNIRAASYLYLGTFIILFYQRGLYKQFVKKPHISFKKIDWVILILIILGVIGQNLYYFRMGFTVPEGILNVVYNQPDHYWHTSMVNELVKRIPPHEPGMYGILKTNYHYWFNLVTAELVRVFRLPLFQTQYLGMYVFGSVMVGMMSYVLANYILPSKFFSRLVVFFFYFSSDAAYWIVLLASKKFDFKVPSVFEHGALFMDNPPRAFSVIIALAAIYLLFLYIDKKYKNVFVMALIFGSLVGFKIYTGIATAFGLSALAAYHLFFKRNITTSILVVITGILSALVFFPVNAKSGGIFFLPFERGRDFITYKPLGFHDLEMRWRVYEEHKNTPRLIQLGVIMTAIYILAQYGIKILGFIPYKKTLQILGREKVLFLYAAMLPTIFIGIFFSQKAHVSDSFNFFMPAIIILIFLTSLNLTFWLQKRSMLLKTAVISLLIIFSLPRWIYNVSDFLPEVFALQRGSFVPNKELESYYFLRDHTPQDSLVLVMNRFAFDGISAIVSIYSDRNMYLSGQGVIIAHDAVNEERVKTVQRIIQSNNYKVVNELLRKNKIDYVYFYGNPALNLGISPKKLQADKVFDNGFAQIFKMRD